jgi:hypothetical protein
MSEKILQQKKIFPRRECRHPAREPASSRTGLRAPPTEICANREICALHLENSELPRWKQAMAMDAG